MRRRRRVRDIRDDLKERLTGVEERRAKLRDEIKDLDAEVAAINQMLQIESRRHHMTNYLKSAGFERRTPIMTFIHNLLNDRPLSKEDIRVRAEAAGYFQGEEA